MRKNTFKGFRMQTKSSRFLAQKLWVISQFYAWTVALVWTKLFNGIWLINYETFWKSWLITQSWKSVASIIPILTFSKMVAATSGWTFILRLGGIWTDVWFMNDISSNFFWAFGMRHSREKSISYGFHIMDHISPHSKYLTHTPAYVRRWCDWESFSVRRFLILIRNLSFPILQR